MHFKLLTLGAPGMISEQGKQAVCTLSLILFYFILFAIT